MKRTAAVARVLSVLSMIGIASVGLPAAGASPPNPVELAIVSAGGQHTCGVSVAENLYCWGANGTGQLGDGTTDGRTTAGPPIAMPTPDPISRITTGDDHTCAVTAAGEAYCWGWNLLGQLGVGDTLNRLAPTKVNLPAGVKLVEISAGGAHTCGVADDGRALCWGSNGVGRLGDGTTTNRSNPVFVSLPVGVTMSDIVAASTHTCARAVSAAAYCWGNNLNGQIGDGTTTNRLTPRAVTAPVGVLWASLIVGGSHTCGISTLAVAYCWGLNGSGQIGDGTTTNRTTPRAVSAPVGVAFVALSGGAGSTCGVATNATAYCWGSNTDGQLGDGTTVIHRTPAPVLMPSGLGVSRLDAGATHVCALTADETYCFGRNSGGQLGTHDTTSRSIPTLVDLTAPSIIPTVSGTVGAEGWYTSDVAIDWTIADPESAAAPATCPSELIQADTAGVVSTCSSTSLGGSAVESVTVKRDATYPVVKVLGAVDGAHYDSHLFPSPTCTTADNLSGVASPATTSGPTLVGGSVKQTWQASCVGATDVAGNLAPPATIEYTVGPLVSVGDATIVEGDGTGTRKVQFPITLTDSSTSPVTVGYAIYPDGSATSASSPSDLVAKSGRVTFKPSPSTGRTPTTKWITAIIRTDDVAELDETFHVEISDPTAGYTVGKATAVGRIVDDDPGTQRHFDVGSISIGEGQGGVTNGAKVAVTLSSPPTAVVRVMVRVVGASATEGTDFKPVTTKILTFTRGQVQKWITINVVPDTEAEGAEIIEVVASAASSGVVGGVSLGTVTILDADA